MKAQKRMGRILRDGTFSARNGMEEWHEDVMLHDEMFDDDYELLREEEDDWKDEVAEDWSLFHEEPTPQIDFDESKLFLDDDYVDF